MSNARRITCSLPAFTAMLVAFGCGPPNPVVIDGANDHEGTVAVDAAPDAPSDGRAVDAPASMIDAPGSMIDAPMIDAPGSMIDAPMIDAPMIDAPMIDAPMIDAPMIDAPMIDAPMIDAPMIDAPMIDAPMIDAPTIDAPSSCPAGQWCTETVPVASGTLLFSVHALSASDVFVVGNAGTILRRTNDTWGAMASGTTQNLRGVWAASATDAWAVGDAGTVLRWNGSTWSQVAGALNIDYTGVWGSGPSDVWLIGTSRVQHWTGSSWATPVSIPGTLMGVSGTGPTNVWVAGESTYLRHYTGSWSVVMPGGGSTNYAIEAIATNDVWASAPGIGTLHFNGSSWAQPGGLPFVDLFAASANDVWGVRQSMAGHWNGSVWTLSMPVTSQSLFGVSGAGGHVWMVGSNATIIHRN